MHVLGTAELADLEVEWLDPIGVGVHVPAPSAIGQQFAGDMHGAVWSGPPHPHVHATGMHYVGDVVDVEIIE